MDGIHATTAKKARALKQRRGKLVATDTKTGKLPKQVIPVLGTAQINESKLRKVPSAALADSSSRADTAGHAATATTAQSATTAGTATRAASASTADRAALSDMSANSLSLGGYTANQITKTWVKNYGAINRTAAMTVNVPSAGHLLVRGTCRFNWTSHSGGVGSLVDFRMDLTVGSSTYSGYSWTQHKDDSMTVNHVFPVSGPGPVSVTSVVTASNNSYTCRGQLVAQFSATTEMM